MTTRRSGGGRPPSRRLRVQFLGAGASKAAGLPLTEELLEHIWPRESTGAWHQVHSETRWSHLLSDATRTLYPQGGSPGFRPQVADFFTVLEVVAQVHEGRERLPLHAADLLRDLRTEVALGLAQSVRGLVVRDRASSHPSSWPHRSWMGSMEPVDVVITSNWDTAAESAGVLERRSVRFAWPRDTNSNRVSKLHRGGVVVLKLHGSTDWGLRRLARWRLTPYVYSSLEGQIGVREPRRRGRRANNEVLRYRSIENEWDEELGFEAPLMATMAVGKTSAIEALDGVWADAYWCLSRASQLDIIGYSFPADDLEIRTLLRAGTRKAGDSGLDPGMNLTVQNPSPEAHDRARGFLGDGLISDYFGAGHAS